MYSGSVVFVLFVFFVDAPLLAAGVGYAAWKGKPKSFDREMYWTAFMATGAVAAAFIVYSLRSMQTDGGTWRHLFQFVCLGIGGLLLGVALGFGAGIFTRPSNSLQKPLL